MKFNKREVINFILGEAAGYLFRGYIIFFLFIFGFEGLLRAIKNDLSFWIKIIPTLSIFTSLYLLYNFFSKKVSEETYGKWSAAGLLFLFFILISYITAVVNYGELLPLSFETIMYGMRMSSTGD